MIHNVDVVRYRVRSRQSHPEMMGGGVILSVYGGHGDQDHSLGDGTWPVGKFCPRQGQPSLQRQATGLQLRFR